MNDNEPSPGAGDSEMRPGEIWTPQRAIKALEEWHAFQCGNAVPWSACENCQAMARPPREPDDPKLRRLKDILVTFWLGQRPEGGVHACHMREADFELAIYRLLEVE